MRYHAALIIASSMLAAGCSTRPREFRPSTAPFVATEAQSATTPEFGRTLIKCQVMVRKGVKGNFANTMAQGAVSTGAGLLAGVAVSSAIPLSTSSSFVNGSAIAAGSSAMLVVGPLAGFGVSRLIRTGREKKYRASLGNCLSEFGYTVTDWEKQKKLSKAEVRVVLSELQNPASKPAADPAPILPSADVAPPPPQR